LGVVTGVGVDGSGNAYILTGSNGVIEVDSNKSFIRQFSSSGSGITQLSSPSHAVVDNANSALYVLDGGNGRVSAWSLEGNPLGVYGSGLLNQPRAFALDGLGGLYIADTGNHRILKIALSDGSAAATFGAGVGSLAGKLKYPEGVAFAPDGNLWVVENGNQRFSVFGKDGTFLKAVTLVGGLFISDPCQLRFKDGLLWELDRGTNNYRYSIRKATSSGRMQAMGTATKTSTIRVVLTST
jgi:DNA-binding beta-propeller fold protein YncE